MCNQIGLAVQLQIDCPADDDDRTDVALHGMFDGVVNHGAAVQRCQQLVRRSMEP